MIDDRTRSELQCTFSDLLNYAAEDPLEPIDPIGYRTPEGDSCLHIAAARGDLHTVGLLVNAGLDVNERGDMGNTVLHYASRQGNSELVQFLLSHGALPELTNEFGQNAIGC